MSGLTKEQWSEINKGLKKINDISTTVECIKTELFGMDGNNGLKSRVRALEGKGKKWLTLIMTIFLFAYVTYDRMERWINNVGKAQSVIEAPTPKP